MNKPVMVELKSGETYNGHLVNCDSWMNVNLKEVICTSPTGDRFWKLPECHIRGLSIKYIRIPDEIIDFAKKVNREKRQAARKQNAAAGGRGGSSGNRGGHGPRRDRNDKGVSKK